MAGVLFSVTPAFSIRLAAAWVAGRFQVLGAAVGAGGDDDREAVRLGDLGEGHDVAPQQPAIDSNRFDN
ncbi:hypothetical protein GCM10010307_29260 [Streptomyces vastus]|uniref:Secreted protein n=1 Tax=Streptomyces vastus TaxID=285451 RepID=A0ABN3QSL9_9ACTN